MDFNLKHNLLSADDEAKTINSFDLTLADEVQYRVTFSNADKGQVLTVKDLADILNSGVSPEEVVFFFLVLGL